MNVQDESKEIISGILSSLNKEDDPVAPMLEAFMEKNKFGDNSLQLLIVFLLGSL